MNHQFMKMAKCKTESQFYKRFPTQDHFFNEFPQMRKYTPGGDVPYKDDNMLAVDNTPDTTQEPSALQKFIKTDVSPYMAPSDASQTQAQSQVVDPKSQVKAYQAQLNALGADLTLDGVWGPKTQAAYDKFITKSQTPSLGSRAGNPNIQPNSVNSGYEDLGEDVTNAPGNWSNKPGTGDWGLSKFIKGQPQQTAQAAQSRDRFTGTHVPVQQIQVPDPSKGSFWDHTFNQPLPNITSLKSPEAQTRATTGQTHIPTSVTQKQTPGSGVLENLFHPTSQGAPAKTSPVTVPKKIGNIPIDKTSQELQGASPFVTNAFQHIVQHEKMVNSLPNDVQYEVKNAMKNKTYGSLFNGNYSVLSKETGKLFLFNAQHELLGSTPVGRGRLKGDTPTAKGNPTTPAGHFAIRKVFPADEPLKNRKDSPRTAYGTPFYSFNNDQVTGTDQGLHGTFVPEKKVRDLILNDPNNTEKLISAGCINADPKWLNDNADNFNVGDSLFVTPEPKQFGGDVEDESINWQKGLVNRYEDGGEKRENFMAIMKQVAKKQMGGDIKGKTTGDIIKDNKMGFLKFIQTNHMNAMAEQEAKDLGELHQQYMSGMIPQAAYGMETGNPPAQYNPNGIPTQGQCPPGYTWDGTKCVMAPIVPKPQFGNVQMPGIDPNENPGTFPQINTAGKHPDTPSTSSLFTQAQQQFPQVIGTDYKAPGQFGLPSTLPGWQPKTTSFNLNGPEIASGIIAGEQGLTNLFNRKENRNAANRMDMKMSADATNYSVGKDRGDYDQFGNFRMDQMLPVQFTGWNGGKQGYYELGGEPNEGEEVEMSEEEISEYMKRGGAVEYC